jgi:hypothetical protein
MTWQPETIGGVYADAVTAPVPILALTGRVGVIRDVRFVWRGLTCTTCHAAIRLWTDGGRIEAGLSTNPDLDITTEVDTGPGTHPDPATDAAHTASAQWFTIYRPATAPQVPPRCPNPECTAQPGTGWLRGADTLTAPPVRADLDWMSFHPLPPHPLANVLLGDKWDTHADRYPDLAAIATARDNARHAAENTEPGDDTDDETSDSEISGDTD